MRGPTPKNVKAFQRRALRVLSSPAGFGLVVLLTVLNAALLGLGVVTWNAAAGPLRAARDNIGEADFSHVFAYEAFDAVYTWVNGSDPIWRASKDAHLAALGGPFVGAGRGEWGAGPANGTSARANGTAEDDRAASHRFRDSSELKYSFRSLFRFAPWLRHVYLVTDDQIPSWLNVEHPRLTVVSHAEIFRNASALPVFSSPAIEANLHRIPGLSKRFVYFNDDVMLGSEVYPEDFVHLDGRQKVYLSWDVPKCHRGCSDSWIGDGFCDKACNVSACSFDHGDCRNVAALAGGSPKRAKPPSVKCAAGCPTSWLHDKVCDVRCNNPSCAYDFGDCGNGLLAALPHRDVLNFTADHELRVVHGAQAVFFNMSAAVRRLEASGFADCTYERAFHNASSVVHHAAVVAAHHLLIVQLYAGQPGAPAIGAFPAHADFHVQLQCSAARGGNASLGSPPPGQVPSAVLRVRVDRDEAAHQRARARAAVAAAAVLDAGPGPGAAGGANAGADEGAEAGWPWITAVEGLSAPCPRAAGAAGNASSSASILRTPLLAADGSTGGVLLLSEGGDAAAVARELPKWRREAMEERLALRVTTLGGANASQATKETRTIPACDLTLLLAEQRAVLRARGREPGGAPPRAGERAAPTLLECMCMAPSDECRGDAPLLLPVPLPSLAAPRGARQDWHVVLAEMVSQGGDGDALPCSIALVKPLDAEEGLARENRTAAAGAGPGGEAGGRRLQALDARGGRTEVPVLRGPASDAAARRLLRSAAAPAAAGEGRAPDSPEPDWDASPVSSWRFWQRLARAAEAGAPGEPRGERRRLERVDTYRESLKHVNRLYHDRFGVANRKVPAHMPHMIDRGIMEEMQSTFADEWRRTAGRRFRSAQDMQYAFSYFYYLKNRYALLDMNAEAIFRRHLDADGDGVLSDNEVRTLVAMSSDPKGFAERKAEIIDCFMGSAVDANATREAAAPAGVAATSWSFTRRPALADVMACAPAMEGLRQFSFGKGLDAGLPYPPTADGDIAHVAFEMLSNDLNETVARLDSVRSRRTKFICINDNRDAVSEEEEAALRDFFESFFSEPSPFELPEGRVNGALRTSEYRRARRGRRAGGYFWPAACLLSVLCGLALARKR